MFNIECISGKAKRLLCSLFPRTQLLALCLGLMFFIPTGVHAQIVYRGAAQAISLVATSFAVPKPAGVVERDVLIASVALSPNTATVSSPAGWILVLDTPQAAVNSSRLVTYYKVAGASEPASYTWTVSGVSISVAVGISAFGGIDTASPIVVSAAAATPTSLTHSAPSVSPNVPSGVLVTSHEYASSSSWAPPNGMTEAVDVATSPTLPATGVTLSMNYKALSGAGATGGQIATAANNADAGAAHSLILRALPVLTKVSSASAAVQNSVVTFSITMSNPGTTDLSAVTVTDVLPASMAYVTSAVSTGSVAVSGQNLTWTIPTIPAGETAQLTLAVRLLQSGVLSNTASSNVSGSATASVLSLTGSITHFKFDAPVGSWTGAVGEVLDSGGTNLHGRRITTSAPTATNEVLPATAISSQFGAVNGDFCNAARFDRRAVVEVANSPLFDYTTQLSASAWIFPTAYPSVANGADLFSVLSNDVNYEFHIDRNGKLYWWWNGPSITSATTIPLNQWTHVAITFNSTTGQQRIYINGVADVNVGTWKGTLTANNCNFYVGGDVGTGTCAVRTDRNFQGLIDEVKLYNTQLSEAQVRADMTIGRSCSGTFDHIRIEHDGNGSICNPETVTIKACQNASCSTLYPGDVQVQLTPTGAWTNGDSFTVSGGVATRQIGRSTAGAVTLGTVNVSPAPGGATRCFAGSTESCTMTFASASCSFDAVEQSAAPKSRLFTKLAGTQFNVDVLALNASATVNTGYTGAVAVDLVDASTVDCPTGSGLNASTNVVFASGNSGRKNLSLTYPNAASNVRVRMRVGASAPACSTDNFSIRPTQLQVTAPTLDNASLAGSPSAVAGSSFALEAAALNVSGGYVGSAPAVVPSKVKDHNNVTVANGSFSGSFNSASGTKASGSSFKYLDVGNLQFEVDGVVDSAFTGVDRVNADCVVGSTSNTLSGGKYGCNIGSAASPKFGRWFPSHYSFTGTITPSCAAGGFTYMDEDALGVLITIKAHASSGGTASATDPVVSRYTTGYTNLASVTISGDNDGPAVATSRLSSPTFPTMPNSALWSSGQWVINDTYAFSKLLVSPDGPYDSFKLKAAIADPDGSTFFSATNETGTTRIRYGQLRMSNVYGSELMSLPVPLEARYWNGTFYVTNTLDRCTTLNLSSIAMSGFTGNLAACETQISPTATQTLSNGKLSGSGIVLSRPGQGNSGSVQLTMNVGTTASGSTCISSTSSSATAANRPWFGSNPTAKATFGVYKSPLIYLRENY